MNFVGLSLLEESSSVWGGFVSGKNVIDMLSRVTLFTKF